MIDSSDENYLTAYDTLCNELSKYSDSLLEKPRIVLLNKIDIEGAFEHAVEAAEKIRAAEPETVVIPVSVHTGRGMKDAQNQIVQLVNRQEERTLAEEKGTAEFGSSFMKDRAGFEDDDDENIQYPGSEA